jgi:hypothetical protein
MARHDNARTKGNTDRGGVTLSGPYFCGQLTGEVRHRFLSCRASHDHQLTGEVTPLSRRSAKLRVRIRYGSFVRCGWTVESGNHPGRSAFLGSRHSRLKSVCFDVFLHLLLIVEGPVDPLSTSIRGAKSAGTGVLLGERWLSTARTLYLCVQKPG